MEETARMNPLNRRRFLALSSAGAASAVLVACGNEPPTVEDLSPTQIPDVAGAPPTLAPITEAPETAGGGGEAAAAPAEDAATPPEGEQEAAEVVVEAPEGEQEAAGGAAEASVEAGDLFFEPSEFEVAPGGTIVLTNIGVLPHDMAVDEWGGVIIGPLDGGAQGDYTVPEDVQPGETFTFYCSIPGHREAGMEGTLTIV